MLFHFVKFDNLILIFYILRSEDILFHLIISFYKLCGEHFDKSDLQQIRSHNFYIYECSICITASTNMC